MSLLSIIIPTYNRIDLLRQTLASIPMRDSRVHEVIVVDDGSSDGTLNFLRSDHPAIKVICQRNAGPGAARNRGVEQAQGDYVAFLDSDDLWFPWTPRVYCEALMAGESDLLFGKPKLFRSVSELNTLENPQMPVDCITFKDYFAAGDKWRWWGASSFVVRRSRLKSIRFVENPINAEDADWVLKIGHGVPLVQITGCPTFGYREHDGSVMKNVSKTLAGAWNLVNSEVQQVYPGGERRRKERLRILGRHLRPVIIAALKNGPRSEGRKLLRATINWQIEERRFRFILASLLCSLKP